MIELLLVLGGIVAIGLVGLGSIVITPRLMTELGFWMLAGGLLIGIPTGIWYHVELYKQLSPRITLPRRWWRAPVELHPQLTPQEYRKVRPWFVVGAVGFLLCCLGGIAAIIGLSVIKLQE